MSVSAPMQDWLRAQRSELNTRYAAARHRWPQLDGEAFLAYLRGTLDPLLHSLAQAPEAARRELLDAGYELGLRLLGQELIGSRARVPAIVPIWRRVATRAPQVLAQAPRRVLSALANACVHFQATPGARIGEWLSALDQAAPALRDVDTLLRAGQLAAWRAGLTHFRDSALAQARHLDAEVLHLLLGGADAAAAHERWQRHQADPWFHPERPAQGPRLAARVGNFRGFGGVFRQPPEVRVLDRQFLVRAGAEVYVLYVDAYGHSLHAVAAELYERADSAALPAGWRCQDGQLTAPGLQLDCAVYGGISGWACGPHTVLLSHPGTHSLSVLARA